MLPQLHSLIARLLWRLTLWPHPHPFVQAGVLRATPGWQSGDYKAALREAFLELVCGWLASVRVTWITPVALHLHNDPL